MFRYFVAPLFWAGFILFLSSIPGKELPDLTLWQWLSFDKIAHLGLYAILAFQVLRACYRQYSNWNLRYYAYPITAISGTVYGMLVEVFQATVLNDRHGEWLDVIANVIGTFAGIWIFRLIFYEYIR